MRVSERDVMREVYETFAPRIRRFLHGLLGDLSAADDWTQETFARAFTRRSAAGEGEPIAPWLFGIARNVSLEIRRARRRDGPRDAFLAPEPAACGPSPEAWVMGQQLAGAALRALAKLPEERRAALLLRVDHALSYEEVAAAMGWSVAKAKIEVHRARLVLRAELDAHQGGSP